MCLPEQGTLANWLRPSPNAGPTTPPALVQGMSQEGRGSSAGGPGSLGDRLRLAYEVSE